MENYREEHGLSQRQFAQLCGLSNGFISMLEKNLNPKTGQPIVPSLANMQKLAVGMNLTMHELFQKIGNDIQLVDVSEKNNQPSANMDSGLTAEIIRLFISLPEERKQEALNYLRYLANK